MEQKNWKPQYPLKLIFEDNGFKIWQGPNIRNFGEKINSHDSVFYIETDGKCRYSKWHPIKALEYIYQNMIYEGEREKVRQMLRETFDL